MSESQEMDRITVGCKVCSAASQELTGGICMYTYIESFRRMTDEVHGVLPFC
jgi:hypothetical protein